MHLLRILFVAEIKSPKWFAITRQLIKSNHGFSGSISSLKRNKKLINKVFYRSQDCSINSILVHFDWASDNNGKKITLVEEIADLMKEKIVFQIKRN